MYQAVIERPWAADRIVAERRAYFWSEHWSRSVEIRNEACCALYGLWETHRQETHKCADYCHYQVRICRWISAWMWSFSQPDKYLPDIAAYCPIHVWSEWGILCNITFFAAICQLLIEFTYRDISVYRGCTWRFWNNEHLCKLICVTCLQVVQYNCKEVKLTFSDVAFTG